MIPALAHACVAIAQSPALSLVIKGTIVLALGLLAVRLAARARASVRHAILASTFGVVLALPLAGFVRLEIPVSVPALPMSNPDREMAVAMPPGAPSPNAAVERSGATPASVVPRVPWADLARALWIAGAACFAARLGAALWHLRRVRRTGIPRLDLRRVVGPLAGETGVPSVHVLVHEESRMPMTFGIRTPVIVLPADAPGWDADDLRRALVHELEHVRRRDWALQLAARAICALWWFHPLVWTAWRRLGLEAERACDDAVVGREEGVDYAEQLVVLAGRLSAAGPQPMLGMAKRSDLAARVSALLDNGQPRGRAGVSTLAAAGAAALSVLLAVAPLRAVVVSKAGASAPPGRTAPRTQGQRSLDAELLAAARYGDADNVARLVQAGANVNDTIAGDGSPLIAAVRSGQEPVVALLLDRGANPNLRVPGDGSPLIAAAAAGRVDLVHLLLDRGADPDLGAAGDGGPLIAAAAAGRADVVALLLDRGADVDLVVPGDENALIRAAAAGHLDVVKALVKRGADVNARVRADAGGWNAPGEWRTPLGMARKGRHADVIAFLVAAGARE